MRLILAIILLLGASGVAVAQFAPWQPMLWKPTTATPPPAPAPEDLLTVMNNVLTILDGPTTTTPPPVTSPADLELTVMNNVLTILN